MIDDFEIAKKAALRLLSFRPRSESEIRERLARNKIQGSSVDRVVEWLQNEKMLDDEKFAKLYALSTNQSRAYGKGRIRQELTRRGVSPLSVTKALASIGSDEEFEAARGLAERQLSRMQGLANLVKKRRLHGLLARRGFSSEVIFKVLGQILSTASGKHDENE